MLISVKEGLIKPLSLFGIERQRSRITWNFGYLDKIRVIYMFLLCSKYVVRGRDLRTGLCLNIAFGTCGFVNNEKKHHISLSSHARPRGYLVVDLGRPDETESGHRSLRGCQAPRMREIRNGSRSRNQWVYNFI